ncbi:O-methyltransferase [Nitratireductor indicus C115]|uniref:O-methyltransferase n=1 Tax=Nitratireductor indicus C115 TaxID=1231190 RepID=K2NYI4_9HYPH|nr:class I SAM-dependent methyltransferase [Nitratireductor indicus]EKF40106.1 O-methyltransferase [Nitratireductor indicus C115]SFQ79748.1 Predicted O-methyltransferase YrrM [Nitratireductor indicus]
MSCTLHRANVVAILKREHQAARTLRDAHRAKQKAEGEFLTHEHDFRTSELHLTQYLSVGPATGRFLYACARSINAQNIVEFGSSFGISTLYLAAAAADTGGRVTGSEYHASKAAKANANLVDAGLSGSAHVIAGDARETLAAIRGPIDLLFLDGAKELYFDLLLMLEERLRPGALVIADNADMLPEEAGFLLHVGEGSDRYVTSLIGFYRGLVSLSVVLPQG